MKLRIGYKPSFIRAFFKLSSTIQGDARSAMQLFQHNPHNPILRMHKLEGKFYGCSSFSVNYKYRIVFTYQDKNTVVFLDIGNHDIYR